MSGKSNKTKTPRRTKRPADRSARRKKTSSKPRTSDSNRWSAGERKWDRVAAAEGIAPLGTLEEIARGTPEDAEELLDAIRLSREMDLAAKKKPKLD